MLYAKYYSGLVALLAIATSAISAAPLKSGVCYSPWHHSGVSGDVVGKDLAQVKQYFSKVRTFHASFSGVNVIDAANAAGLRVSVGIMMNDKAGISKEIQAACDGAKRHPESVEAIYVGNENLAPNGAYSAQELIGYIQQLKGCTAGTNIPIGTVQRINEWLSAPGIKDVAAACDKIGTNIYPFFTPGPKSPMEKFMDQYNQITGQYAANKVVITETGWPRAGSPSPQGNVPNAQTTQTFFNEFSKWAESHPDSYFFMMYDSTTTNGGGDYEKFFGLANTNGQLQIQIAGGSGSEPVPAPAPGPASTPGSSTPGSSTPGSSTPGSSTPGSSTPSSPGSAPAPAPPAVTPAASAPGTPAVVPGPAPVPNISPAMTPAIVRPYDQVQQTAPSAPSYCA